MYIYKFKQINKEVYDLANTINILSWDLNISAPINAKEDIIKLITNYESKLFSITTSKEYGFVLESLLNSEEVNDLSKEEIIILKRLYKDYLKYIKIPPQFYKEYVELIRKSTLVWQDAKEKNDYELFKPYLKDIIRYKKKYLDFISDNTDKYNIMLEEFEEGLTKEVLDELFNKLKKELIPLIKGLKKKDINIKINASKDDVMKCAKYLLDYIGFNNNSGTLGNYPHGYTETVGKNDVRIAFKETNDALDFVTTIIHEGGHGILEQNINPKLSIYYHGCASGINALHESQSRFFENILGRNINFWIPIYEDVKKMLGLKENIYEFVDGLNNAYPSLIRTESDELTYVMHIIIRYEIETALFNDTLSVDDIPNEWNKLMNEYLGIIPNVDSEGLLQDVHWAESEFGYFPSYLIGSIFDCLFMRTITRNLGDIDTILKEGNIKKITNYLIENVYKTAGAYTGVEVLKKLGEDTITVEPLITYFKNKYGVNND